MADTPTHFIVYHILTGSLKEVANGSNYSSWYTADYVRVNDLISQEVASILNKRDSLLAACDWTQVADAPVNQAAWSTYRQALRDLPDQAGFPDNVTWPTAPTDG